MRNACIAVKSAKISKYNTKSLIADAAGMIYFNVADLPVPFVFLQDYELKETTQVSHATFSSVSREYKTLAELSHISDCAPIGFNETFNTNLYVTHIRHENLYYPSCRNA